MDPMYSGHNSVCACYMGMIGKRTHSCTDGAWLDWCCLWSIYYYLKGVNMWAEMLLCDMQAKRCHARKEVEMFHTSKTMLISSLARALTIAGAAPLFVQGTICFMQDSLVTACGANDVGWEVWLHADIE